ncbi:hypothetical protein GOP47_0011064 [Adiantum capillus-veneris]|uniref:Cupin type-1 domain-containing protein n=1 Tax=Adiantum capillus-veneris TaxID=13818 RepID=A0A9D4USK9_ADICA|nr:hypothetical protein GOP47_0011064 [Adiantum capillus-veneris]
MMILAGPRGDVVTKIGGMRTIGFLLCGERSPWSLVDVFLCHEMEKAVLVVGKSRVNNGVSLLKNPEFPKSSTLLFLSKVNPENASWRIASLYEIRLLGLPIPILLQRKRETMDPDPVSDFSENAMTFTFRDMFTNGDVTHGAGGTRVGLNISLFPAMESQGLTYVMFQAKPCGINLPHTHPRASEMLTLIQGGPLQVGFVDSNGNAHVDVMHEGDVTIFPRGLLHFELNIGEETAHFVSALDSENPGTLMGAGALFQLPIRALAASMNQHVVDMLAIKSTMYDYRHALEMSTIAGCVPGKNIVNNF